MKVLATMSSKSLSRISFKQIYLISDFNSDLIANRNLVNNLETGLEPKIVTTERKLLANKKNTRIQSCASLLRFLCMLLTVSDEM